MKIEVIPDTFTTETFFHSVVSGVAPNQATPLQRNGSGPKAYLAYYFLQSIMQPPAFSSDLLRFRVSSIVVDLPRL